MSATAQDTDSPRMDLAELMRRAWPKHAAKHAATAAGCSVRTAQDWIQRRTCPSADTLLRMAAKNQQLARELARRLETRRDEGMAQRMVDLCETPGGGTAAKGRDLARAVKR